MKFNINDMCRVHLTSEGAKVMRENGFSPDPSTNILETQFWCLMAGIGPHLRMGGTVNYIINNEIEMLK